MNLEDFKASLGLADLSDEELRNRIPKFCNGCGEFKPVSEFYIRSDRSSADRYGRVARCKTCATANYKTWYNNNLAFAQQRARERGYINRHGDMLEPGEAEKLSKNNQGECDLCGNLGMIQVDHCHKTGIRRGFLCSQCNMAIGNFKDNPELLRKAADYIEHFMEVANVRTD